MARRIVDQLFELKCKCLSMESGILDMLSLSPADYNVLEKMGKDEVISATDFAVRLDLSLSRGSRIINRMLKNGYLASIPAAEDRRRVMLSLTEKGCQAKKQIADLKTSCNQRIVEKLSKDQLDNLSLSLDDIMETLLIESEKKITGINK
ncbi:MarR family transcriptional regulator [bacterium]|nr:MarR family transcriptional regulator [bacterium]